MCTGRALRRKVSIGSGVFRVSAATEPDLFADEGQRREKDGRRLVGFEQLSHGQSAAGRNVAKVTESTAPVPRRPRCARLDTSRASCATVPGPGGCACCAVGQGPGDPALHGPLAPQSSGTRSRAHARGADRGLPRHDLRRHRSRGRNPAERLSLGSTRRKSARTTHAIERLNEEARRRVRTRTGLPCAETVPMLLWALLASGQIQMRKADGPDTLSYPFDPMPLDLAAWEHDHSHARSAPPRNFHQIRDTTGARNTRLTLSGGQGSDVSNSTPERLLTHCADADLFHQAPDCEALSSAPVLTLPLESMSRLADPAGPAILVPDPSGCRTQDPTDFRDEALEGAA